MFDICVAIPRCSNKRPHVCLSFFRDVASSSGMFATIRMSRRVEVCLLSSYSSIIISCSLGIVSLLSSSCRSSTILDPVCWAPLWVFSPLFLSSVSTFVLSSIVTPKILQAEASVGSELFIFTTVCSVES